MDAGSLTREARRRQLLDRVGSRRVLPPPRERREIRKAAGVSLRELAGVIGVSHVAITRWEAGAEPADPGHLAAYADLLADMRRLCANGSADP